MNVRCDFFFVVLLATVASASAEGLAIVNVTVIDVQADTEKEARLENQTVLIVGDRIARIAPTNEVDVPPNIDRVDGAGMYLVPGFFDAHAHLSWPGDDTAKIVLPLLFANGITGVRDMNSDSPPPMKSYGELRELQSAIESGEVLGPRIMALCRWIGGSRQSNVMTQLNTAPLTREHGRRAARTAKTRRVDFVKVYSSLSRDAFFGLIEEANRLGLPVAGHLPEAVTPIEASNAGMHCIEHARFPALACGPGYEQWRAACAAYNSKTSDRGPRTLYREHQRTLINEFDETRCLEILDTLAKNGTRICPTHTTRKMDAFASDPAYRSDPRRKYISPERLAGWDRDLNNYADAPPALKTYYKEFFDLGLRVTGLAHERGVHVLAGTDCYDTHVFPGFSYHDELQHLRQAGMSALEVLKAATIRPAEFLGVEDTFGSVAVEKKADLVLLRADPLADISNTTEIQAVILDGKVHLHGALQTMIQEVEAWATAQKDYVELQAFLWDAIIRRESAETQLAVDRGADVNALDTRQSGTGRRALNYAALNNDTKIIQALLDAGAKINLPNRSGFTPLMHAAESGSIKAAKILIESGANLTLKNKRRQTALAIAELQGHTDIAAAIRDSLPETKSTRTTD